MSKKTIWQELYKLIDSINNELRSDNMDKIAIDFWLFKIKRRIKIIQTKIELF